MKLMHLLEDQQPDSPDNLRFTQSQLRFFDKLQNTSAFSTFLNGINSPTHKAMAVLKFALMLGIPKEKIIPFLQNSLNRI